MLEIISYTISITLSPLDNIAASYLIITLSNRVTAYKLTY